MRYAARFVERYAKDQWLLDGSENPPRLKAWRLKQTARTAFEGSINVESPFCI